MPKITEKLTFKRGLTLKNRIVMAPMTVTMSFHNGVVTEDEINYYKIRSGEVGAVIVAASYIQNDGKGWEGQIGISDDIQIEGLRELTDNIKRNGTRAIIQLYHSGRMSNSSVLRGIQPVSASAVKAERENAEIPRELTDEEILNIIENFKKATERAIKAGFDGVEIHGANTYLIQQFFSPHSNRRKDEWGGTLEKRYSFINKLVDGVISAVDNSGVKDFIVGYRFSPEEYETPGIRIEDTLYLVDRLADKKLDYLHVSLQEYKKISEKSDNYKEKPIVEYIHEKIKGRLPLITVGEIATKNQAEEALKNAEIIAIGRSMLADPHWADKIMENREEEIITKISKYSKNEFYIKEPLFRFLLSVPRWAVKLFEEKDI